MRVLFHNPNRSASFGGIELWMLDVAAGLRARGHHAVLYGRPGAPWLRAGATQGLPLAAGRFTFDLDPLAVARCLAVLRAHDIDVVVAKGQKATRIAATAARLRQRGRVILFLGVEGELADRLADRWTWRWAVDRAVVLAEEAKLWYERFPWARDGKLRVLLKGVDLAAFDPGCGDGGAVRADLGIEPGAFVIGTVGRLAWQKGQRQLLRATARLAPELPAARVVIVGGGGEEARLRAEAAALGIADRVVFTGHRHDVRALMATMDVFVLPSLYENMPQVLLEAMAMARPVVSTATLGTREVLEDGHSGFVVPCRDPAALAERVLVLARDPELRRAMGARARERIARGFTREDMLARVEDLLEEVIAQRKSTAPAARYGGTPAQSK